jgi:hypothetical protein
VQFSAAENEQMFGVKRRLTARPSQPRQGHPPEPLREYGKCWCAAHRTQTCPGSDRHDAGGADWPGCWFQSAGELLGLQLPFPGPDGMVLLVPALR